MGPVEYCGDPILVFLALAGAILGVITTAYWRNKHQQLQKSLQTQPEQRKT